MEGYVILAMNSITLAYSPHPNNSFNYMMLSVENQESKDIRSLGKLFFADLH